MKRHLAAWISGDRCSGPAPDRPCRWRRTRFGNDRHGYAPGGHRAVAAVAPASQPSHGRFAYRWRRDRRVRPGLCRRVSGNGRPGHQIPPWSVRGPRGALARCPQAGWQRQRGCGFPRVVQQRLIGHTVPTLAETDYPDPGVSVPSFPPPFPVHSTMAARVAVRRSLLGTPLRSCPRDDQNSRSIRNPARVSVLSNPSRTAATPTLNNGPVSPA